MKKWLILLLLGAATVCFTSDADSWIYDFSDESITADMLEANGTTPDGTKFYRDDGKWISITESGEAVDWDNVSVGGGTIDNTPIGGTTPSSGVFTTLVTDNVSNQEIAYLEGVSSGLQGQLDAKRALTNLTFSGPATFDNEVTASQFSTDAADGEHFINVANSTAPSDPTTGDCYYDNVALGWLCYDGDSWEGASGGSTTSLPWDNITSKPELVTPDNAVTFTNKTYDPAATGNAFTFYNQKDFTILDPVAADNSMLFKARYAMTVSAIHCLAEGGGSITLQILECSSTGTSCAGLDASTTITCDSDGAADDGSLSNASIDAGDWVQVLYGAPSGTVNTLTYSIYYSEAQ